ncbi:hypothetical protein [Terriglobus tenax]|uniref:hypothetical protein n=1 Tax=Terriglobus tenax TaxID=1111115 RepID=UPI0021E0CC47|nr:hypothetical protein [Terriglobus tenax]
MLRRVVCLFLLASACCAVAQRRAPSALSDAEVEEIREAAIDPAIRITVFQKALEARINRIEELIKKPKAPGQAEDIHDYMEQFTSIADELDDNLDDYEPKHPDLRKVLPKLLAATERWATVLKTPPDHTAYTLTRKLALEATQDLHDSAREMIDGQTEWWKTHKVPEKRDAPPEPIVVPR